jgi:carbonic anhydrase
LLMDGNKRFVNNLLHDKNLLQMVNETKDGQFPFAAILSCSDSRTSAELVFDQGLGDIFSVRLAGNIATENAIGSLEFACKYLGSKIIVVLGHTSCGAIKGACDNVQEGNIKKVVSHILPAVLNEKSITKDRDSSNDNFVDNVMHINIEQQMINIVENSRILSKMIDEHQVGLVGAIYDVKSGEVKFYDEDQIFNLDEQFVKIRSKLNIS